jgi:hypothetical protein
MEAVNGLFEGRMTEEPKTACQREPPPLCFDAVAIFELGEAGHHLML